MVPGDGELAVPRTDFLQELAQTRQVVDLGIHEVAGDDEDVRLGRFHRFQYRHQAVAPHDEAEMHVRYLGDGDLVRALGQPVRLEDEPLGPDVLCVEIAVDADQRRQGERQCKGKPWRNAQKVRALPTEPCRHPKREIHEVDHDGTAEEEEDERHPEVGDPGQGAGRKLELVPLQRTDEEHGPDHEEHEKRNDDARAPSEPESLPRLQERVDVDTAVHAEYEEKEKDHLPKLTPMPSAIFTSSPSGSTSLSWLIAFSRGTEVMTGG